MSSKIVRESLSDQVYEVMKDKIVSGEWAVGDKIPSENELSAELGVSRNSLRLATQKLNVLGLTETRQGEGTFVKPFSMKPYILELSRMNLITDDHEDFRQFKYAIEEACIKVAVMNGVNREDLDTLCGILEEMETALKAGNRNDYQDADYRFHFTICNLTRNKIFVMLYDAFSDMFYEEYTQSSEEALAREDGIDLLIHHHRNIIGRLESELSYSSSFRNSKFSKAGIASL